MFPIPLPRDCAFGSIFYTLSEITVQQALGILVIGVGAFVDEVYCAESAAQTSVAM